MQSQIIPHKSKVVKVQKDRLGSAIVSFISGIFSIVFLFLSFVMGECVAPLIVSFILSIIGLTLGIRARTSSSGRGLAIAGITLTVVPLIISIVMIILTAILFFTMFH